MVLIFLTLFLTSWDNEAKLFWYFVLEITDAFDGRLAKWAGNDKGIGKIIDPTVDKFDKFFLLLFLLDSKLLERWIIQVIFSGELVVLSIAVIGISLSIRRQRIKSGYASITKFNCREIFGKAKAEILKKWEIDIIGRAAMVLYTSTVALIFLNIRLWKGDIPEVLGIASCFAGVLARIVSIIIYGANVYKAQKELI